MPALLLTLLKLIFVALVYVFVWQVARSVAGHVGIWRNGTSGRRKKVNNVVVVRSETQAGLQFDVKDALVLGRSGEADIQIDDPYASEFHLRLVAKDGGVVVHDLGSTNGTYVNGRRVSSPTTLGHGDAVQVGNTVLELR